MPRKVIRFFGKLAFYLGWPLWYLILNGSRRSRVIIKCGGDVLLVRGWLGDGAWGLPGGGIKKNEDMHESACREAYEETGIKLGSSQLKYCETVANKKYGISTTLLIFEVILKEKPKLKLQKLEIAEARWFKISEAPSNLKLS